MHRLMLTMVLAATFAGSGSRLPAFQPPLTAVQTWLTTNAYAVTVHYRVLDSYLGKTREGQREYEGSFLDYPVVQGLAVLDGVVTWRTGRGGPYAQPDVEVGYAVYDPARVSWMDGGEVYPGSPGFYWTISGLTSSGGTVVWQASENGTYATPSIEIHYGKYDPSRAAWRSGVRRYASTVVAYWVVNTLTLTQGVIAWTATVRGEHVNPETEVGCALYAPNPGTWPLDIRTYSGTLLDQWTASGLTVASGIVAWRAERSGQTTSRSSEVGFTIYDSSREAWRPGSRRYDGTITSPWTITNFNVGSQRVSWTAVRSGQSTAEVRGYDTPGGVWRGAPNTPYAAIQPSVTAGDAPLEVWWADLSIGGDSWAWNFADGTTNNQRNPYHVFTQPGSYTVTQTISGPAGSNTTARTITVYGQGPPQFAAGSAHVTAGEFQVRLEGLTGRAPVVIWGSTDLRTWTPIHTNAPTPGALDFKEPLMPAPGMRFYRAAE